MPAASPEVLHHAVAVDPVPRSQIKEQDIVLHFLHDRLQNREEYDRTQVAVEESVNGDLPLPRHRSLALDDAVDELLPGAQDLQLRQPRSFAAKVSNPALTALLKLQPNRLGHGSQAAVWQLFCMLDQPLVIAVELRKGRSTRLVDTEELTAVEVAAADDDLDKAA